MPSSGGLSPPYPANAPPCLASLAVPSQKHVWGEKGGRAFSLWPFSLLLASFQQTHASPVLWPPGRGGVCE